MPHKPQRPPVHVHASPDTWRVVVSDGGMARHHTIGEARDLADQILAAADLAEREQAIEASLPLRDRVWLYLSRLVWWHPRGIADDLGVPVEKVLAVLQALAAEGKVENHGGAIPGAWRAIEKHPRARIDETIGGA